MAALRTTPKKIRVNESPRADQDSAWKEILDAYLRAFRRFFFPQNERRYEWKLRLLRDLYRRGRTREEITALFIFMDWAMRLPEPLNERILQEAHELEVGKKMPYVKTSWRGFRTSGLRYGG
jgi:hypothetical protein